MGDDTRSKDSTSSISWSEEDDHTISASCSNKEVGESSRMAASRNDATSSTSTMINSFIGMGFQEDMVIKAMNETDGTTEDEILSAILKHSGLEEPLQDKERNSADMETNDYDFVIDLSDDDDILNEMQETCGPSSANASSLFDLVKMGFGDKEAKNAIDVCGNDTPMDELIQFIRASRLCNDVDASLQEEAQEEHPNSSFRRESVGSPDEEYMPLASLLEMGFTADEAFEAIDRCGQETPFDDLIQFIEAARYRHDEDAPQQEYNIHHNNLLKRKQTCSTSGSRKMKRPQTHTKEEEILHLPKPMIGFGVPCHPLLHFSRSLRDDATGPPYFYYENVALTPKGTWHRIRRCLFDIEPEFVDSKYFSAAYRKRGYIHNLPTSNRFQLHPIPPSTIQEALPESESRWRSWDTRTKLNCLVTCVATAKLTERIRILLKQYSDNGQEPPLHVRNAILRHCKKWNLIWVGKNKLAPLEPHEMEVLMGFPINHTRGFSKTDRHKFLGNSFQVDTVAYHLSVLKNMYPEGLNVLSLFSGIGGAEVALDRLGIPLKNVVSVENNKQCQDIVKDWWEQTEQGGKLIHIDDVQKVDQLMLEQWVSEFGGFDLVIGGSPCNNLAGGNRVSRDGLEGEHSALFYHYLRILSELRRIMRQQ